MCEFKREHINSAAASKCSVAVLRLGLTHVSLHNVPASSAEHFTCLPVPGRI